MRFKLIFETCQSEKRYRKKMFARWQFNNDDNKFPAFTGKNEFVNVSKRFALLSEKQPLTYEIKNLLHNFK